MNTRSITARQLETQLKNIIDEKESETYDFLKSHSSPTPRKQLESEDVKGNTKHGRQEDTKDIFVLSSECQLLQTIPKPKPSQSVSRNKIEVLESELNSLVLARDIGIATDKAIKRIATLKKDIHQEK
ncbi:unnamed protein product [Euphydryas editha]|uniref:Uncharacterized protein n=1 Tax=Euphydryas editha TaxID=104508 RepID=A0AAU9T9L0_EUPED|nr:unnamed protein product [Euphydryas editha]